jgi:hypothetical protein
MNDIVESLLKVLSFNHNAKVKIKINDFIMDATSVHNINGTIFICHETNQKKDGQ